MTKANRRHLTYSTCHCGQVLYGNIGPHHFKSTRHRHAAEIRSMLESGATLLEVGTKFGITRERVRQIAKVLNIQPAAQRLRDRSEKQALAKFFNHLQSSRLGRFLKAAVQQGFTDNQLVPLTKAKYAGQYYSDRVWIGGKLVMVRSAYGCRNGDEAMVSVNNTNIDVDYVAYELPDGHWLFLEPWDSESPRKNGQSGSTMFTLRDVPVGSKGYTYSKRHHFRERIEAWHLLRAE